MENFEGIRQAMETVRNGLQELYGEAAAAKATTKLDAAWLEMDRVFRMVEAVKGYAKAHYTEGWDVVVECWTDQEIAEELASAGATQPNTAIRAMKPVAAGRKELQEQAIVDGYGSREAYEAERRG